MSNKRVVIALGYFDGIHKGHKSVIESAKQMAKEYNCSCAVFTFDGNLRGLFKNGEKSIFTYEERLSLIKSQGVDTVITAPTTKTFLSKGRLAFLRFLEKNYTVVGYAVGEDYTFSKNAKGNVEYLKAYAEKNGRKVSVSKEIVIDGKRVSSSLIKEYLKKGEIEKANGLLSTPYFITGKVVKGRNVGKMLGYPTANITLNKDKLLLKSGVYSGYAIIRNKRYKAVINYGEKPTFNILSQEIEAHVIEYNGNLYGKEITLYFTEYLREIKKFTSEKELVEQIEKDVKRVKKL